MSLPNPQEEITKLEGELKQMQDNYLEAESTLKNADQVMKNCRDRIIAIQSAIDTNKKYLPEKSVKTEPAGFAKN
jgi:predicted  nucleic acid-binding Zn-ribbon protein